MTLICAEELLERKIGRFNSHFYKKRSSDYSLREFLGEVRGSDWKSKITEIRKADLEVHKIPSSEIEKVESLKVKKLKSSLPCVTISGVGDRGMKDEHSKFIHSGLLQVDLDKKDHLEWDIAEMLKLINNDSHTLASFLSPSGGVKVIVAIESDCKCHSECFRTASDYFAELGLKMDQKTKDVGRLCYLSHDPNPFTATGDVEPFLPSVNATQKHRSTVTQKHSNKGEYKRGSRFEHLRLLQDIAKEELKWISDAHSDPITVQLWKEFVSDRYDIDYSKRNEILCNFIAYAYPRMSRDCAMKLSEQMRVLWDFFCTDSMGEHMKQAQSLWMGCEKTFQGKLNSDELEFYQLLSKTEYRDVFRICRDLALCEKGRIGEFFLSSRNLALRIGVEHTRAWRILREMKSFGIIDEISQGTRGSKGSASSFRWAI
jgi:hypothetical protein